MNVRDYVRTETPPDYCDHCGCHWGAHMAYRPGGSCNFCLYDRAKHSQHRTNECERHSCPHFWKTPEYQQELMNRVWAGISKPVHASYWWEGTGP